MHCAIKLTKFLLKLLLKYLLTKFYFKIYSYWWCYSFLRHKKLTSNWCNNLFSMKPSRCQHTTFFFRPKSKLRVMTSSMRSTFPTFYLIYVCIIFKKQIVDMCTFTHLFRKFYDTFLLIYKIVVLPRFGLLKHIFNLFMK